jgi:hypothetical protein
VIDTRNDAESTRKEGTKINYAQRVEPLNLQKDVNLMIIEQQKGQVSRDISVRSKENSSVKSKYDDFINFLDNVE